jgi:hypothetical protein
LYLLTGNSTFLVRNSCIYLRTYRDLLGVGADARYACNYSLTLPL